MRNFFLHVGVPAPPLSCLRQINCVCGVGVVHGTATALISSGVLDPSAADFLPPLPPLLVFVDGQCVWASPTTRGDIWLNRDMKEAGISLKQNFIPLVTTPGGGDSRRTKSPKTKTKPVTPGRNNTNAPNAKLVELINLNKSMFPNSFIKPPR